MDRGTVRAGVLKLLVGLSMSAAGDAAAPAQADEADLAARARHGHERRGRAVVYASERAVLSAFALDPHTGRLDPRGAVTLPAQVQYAVADRGSRILYVAASDFAALHSVHAFSIDPETGRLAPLGAPFTPEAGRVIHLSITPDGSHLVLAHNATKTVTVVALAQDGGLGAAVPQPDAPLDTGVFTHHAAFDPTGRTLVVSALGADATVSAPEQRGRLTAFTFARGRLTKTATVETAAGVGPRHVAFHPDRPLLYVAAERGNQLLVHGFSHGALAPIASYQIDALAEPRLLRPRQRVGAIRVHPNGGFAYVSNRADARQTVTLGGSEVEIFAGGENNIAVFSLSRRTGAPTLIEHVPTGGIEPRTFDLDPAGRFLVVGNQAARNRLDGPTVTPVSRSVVVFRVGRDGRLTEAHRRELTSGDVFWVGVVPL